MATPDKVLGGLAVASNRTDWPSKGGSLVRSIRGLPVDAAVKTILIELTCGIQEAHLSLAGMYIATADFQGSADPDEKRRIMRLKALGRICRADDPDAMIRRLEFVAAIHRMIEEAYDSVVLDPTASLEGLSGALDEGLDTAEEALGADNP